MWVAAIVTTIPLWKRVMQKMKELNEGAWKDMMDTPANFGPDHILRHIQSVISK